MGAAENLYEFTLCPNHFLIKERYAKFMDNLEILIEHWSNFDWTLI